MTSESSADSLTRPASHVERGEGGVASGVSSGRFSSNVLFQQNSQKYVEHRGKCKDFFFLLNRWGVFFSEGGNEPFFPGSHIFKL